MAEEELDLNENNQEEIISRKDSRIKSLSDKVKTTSEERDALATKAQEAEAKALSAQKDAEFYKGFNPMTTKYPGASEYQDKIREKAALGLDVEEATMLVMAKEGKYTPAQAPVERESVIGGSANTTMKSGESKKPEEMTQAERRAAIEEGFAKGEITL